MIFLDICTWNLKVGYPIIFISYPIGYDILKYTYSIWNSKIAYPMKYAMLYYVHI